MRERSTDNNKQYSPRDPQTLFAMLADSARANPSSVSAWIDLAVAARALNRPEEELAALDRALALEPMHVRALLQKASVLEARGRTIAAAMTYRNALQIVPPGIELPADVLAILQHARAIVHASNCALENHLESKLAALRERHASTPSRRFEECLATVLQKQPVYQQKPTFLFFPELAPVAFHERAAFPWLDRVEAATDDIRAELLQLLAGEQEGFEPYVSFREGVPMNQWRTLNNSRRWSVYYLWREGVPVRDHIARCPRTLAALERWPRWDAKGPTVVFSVLDAKTRIPPHTGVYNTRLTVHLPLVIPPGCGLRVGGQKREWRPGEAFVFDDTMEHEAWNDSAVPRAVLIFDTWNPALSAAERDLVRSLVAGVEEYYAAA